MALQGHDRSIRNQQRATAVCDLTDVTNGSRSEHDRHDCHKDGVRTGEPLERTRDLVSAPSPVLELFEGVWNRGTFNLITVYGSDSYSTRCVRVYTMGSLILFLMILAGGSK